MEVSKKSILIVDDSARAIARLSEIYLRMGWEVAGVAHNGVEALQFLEKRSVDLVSLDIIMPLMDGVETFNEIRKRKFDCECFFVSVLAGEPRVVQAYANTIPPERLISKSLSDEALTAILKKVTTNISIAAGATTSEAPAATQL